MAKHRTHSIEFKRQVVQEFLGGESPHALSPSAHGISRNLIKIWVAKYDAGGLDSDDDDADVLAEAAQLKHVCAIFAPCPGLSGVSPQSSSMTVPG
jgi:transposase-like protein